MQRQARRDTTPELAVRRAVHRRGLRYFVDRAPIGGCRTRADLVFPSAKVAVFVDGCFWHACPKHGTSPRANRDWWKEKLKANRARDARTNAALQEAGWLVIRAWEHEPAEDVAERVFRAVAERRRAMPD